MYIYVYLLSTRMLTEAGVGLGWLVPDNWGRVSVSSLVSTAVPTRPLLGPPRTAQHHPAPWPDGRCCNLWWWCNQSTPDPLTYLNVNHTFVLIKYYSIAIVLFNAEKKVSSCSFLCVFLYQTDKEKFNFAVAWPFTTKITVLTANEGGGGGEPWAVRF